MKSQDHPKEPIATALIKTPRNHMEINLMKPSRGKNNSTNLNRMRTKDMDQNTYKDPHTEGLLMLTNREIGCSITYSRYYNSSQNNQRSKWLTDGQPCPSTRQRQAGNLTCHRLTNWQHTMANMTSTLQNNMTTTSHLTSIARPFNRMKKSPSMATMCMKTCPMITSPTRLT